VKPEMSAAPANSASQASSGEEWPARPAAPPFTGTAAALPASTPLANIADLAPTTSRVPGTRVGERVTRSATVAALLCGPFVLAFVSGGYFDEPRSVAAALALALVALAALSWPRLPLPPTPSGLVMLGGLAGLTAWTAISAAWAPDADRAHDDLVRLLLYTATLALASAAFHTRRLERAVEPLLAAGVLVVVGYGLAGRLLPGIVELDASLSANGRLEQPLTYWNAMGALAALGFVLAARVAGDSERPAALRAAAAAGAVPLAVGVYLSFSRGALGALLAGLVLLAVLASERSQLRALGVCLALGVLASAAASLFPGVEALEGDRLERDGALMLVVLVVLCGAAGIAQARLARAEAAGRLSVERMGMRAPRAALAGAVVVLVLALPFAAASLDQGGREEPRAGAGAARLSDLGSARYDYWEVALAEFADHPLGGVGSGGFEVSWLRERTLEEVVRDAHSLEFETAAELGVVGVLLLALFLAGGALCARATYRRDPALAAGPSAALVTVLLHAALDWDWEMPSVTLCALVLAGLLAGAADPRRLAAS
jgi:O-antigen ligase